MPKIIKVQKKHMPSVRFIGKPYSHEDGINGYGHRWGEWFQHGWFDQLETLGKVEGIEDGYIGFIHCSNYWIGMFVPLGTEVPDGFSHFDIPAGDVGVCWIHGNSDDGSIYNMHTQCRDALRENGMSNFKEDAAFFERYVCPRFTDPDENGDVILDYAVYLA